MIVVIIITVIIFILIFIGALQDKTERDLFKAVKTNDKETLRKKIAKGASLNIVSKDGTLLQIAVRNGDKDTVSLLIEGGANVNRIYDKKAPLDFAEHTDIKKILRSHGAKTKDELEEEAEKAFETGLSYYTGEGISQNYEKAVELFKKAAELGFAEAQNNLGCCYLAGTGTLQNYSLAFKWFKEAAVQGYASAQNSLGMCYITGWGTAKDYKKAVEWLEKAAEQGDARAQYNLANCYHEGRGVKLNVYMRDQLWEKSANQGFAPAAYNLGLSFYLITKNNEAVEWWKKAAELGDTDAINRINELQSDGIISDFSYRN